MRKTGLSNDRAPACPGPDSHPRRPLRFVVPKGAVDSHAHVIGRPPEYPFVERRSYTPPPATPQSYLAMLDDTGMTYGVLVQVSVHGTDNRLLVETLKANPGRLRGIAVISLDELSDRQLSELNEAGIVGLRLNSIYGGGVGFQELESYAALAREMGWHLQLLADAHDLVPLAGLLGRLTVPFVIDHCGHFPVSRGTADPGFQTLLSLTRDGGWVKLSGAYRNTTQGPPYSDTTPFVRLLQATAPERCVWGSDWPHVAHWMYMMNVGDLLDLLAEWIPDEIARNRVLATNAQHLYGFPTEGFDIRAPTTISTSGKTDESVY